MTNTFQAFSLALLQGVTEFLPISSSGHLVLLPYIFKWQDQGLAFDVAVHVGTLIAIVIYLRHDLVNIGLGVVRRIATGSGGADSRLGLVIFVATLPALLVGLLIGPSAEAFLRHPIVIAAATLVFALVLMCADLYGVKSKHLSELNLKSALIIGVAQAIAFIPGTSRSGITITAALALGHSRRSAARISFLLSIPIILAAGSYKAIELLIVGSDLDWILFLIGISVAFVSAWIFINLFMRWIEVVGMLPFVIYRILLAALIFVFSAN